MLGCERWTATHRSVADVVLVLALGLGLGLVVEVLLALGLLGWGIAWRRRQTAADPARPARDPASPLLEGRGPAAS